MPQRCLLLSLWVGPCGWCDQRLAACSAMLLVLCVRCRNDCVARVCVSLCEHHTHTHAQITVCVIMFAHVVLSVLSCIRFCTQVLLIRKNFISNTVAVPMTIGNNHSTASIQRTCTYIYCTYIHAVHIQYVHENVYCQLTVTVNFGNWLVCRQ
jgi:hypothetical protein